MEVTNVLEERLSGHERRLTTLEVGQIKDREEFTSLMVELKVLQARVSLYAGAVALGVSLAAKYLLS